MRSAEKLIKEVIAICKEHAEDGCFDYEGAEANAMRLLNQFREPSTQGGEEPDFDGPLAMVDHYQRLNKYLTNENARLFNRIRVLEEALKVAIGYLPYNETISGPIKQAINPKD